MKYVGINPDSIKAYFGYATLTGQGGFGISASLASLTENKITQASQIIMVNVIGNDAGYIPVGVRPSADTSKILFSFDQQVPTTASAMVKYEFIYVSY